MTSSWRTTAAESLVYEKDRLLAPLLPGMTAPPHERQLGNDEQAYFLGLPETGRPDDRAGDLSDVEPPAYNTGWPARSEQNRKQAKKQAKKAKKAQKRARVAS